LGEPVLVYQGVLTDQTVARLTGLVNQTLTEEGWSAGDRVRVKALMVEQVQNVQRYSDDAAQGRLEVGLDDSGLFVETRNPIPPALRSDLEARLGFLRSLDNEALRARYRESLHGPTPGTGAGLGLLSLALRSSRALEYGFSGGESRPEFWIRSFP
jgi:hypothetical protein